MTTDWVQQAYATHGGPLLRYATRLLGSPEAGGDVVQDTFVRLCQQHPPLVEPQLVKWLFTVCRNRALDILRKEGRMSQLSAGTASITDPGWPTPEAGLCRSESRELVLAALDGLPPGQQEVIRLKFQNGLSYKEIAAITGRSANSVGVLIHVGLKKLRARLGQREEELR